MYVPSCADHSRHTRLTGLTCVVLHHVVVVSVRGRGPRERVHRGRRVVPPRAEQVPELGRGGRRRLHGGRGGVYITRSDANLRLRLLLARAN